MLLATLVVVAGPTTALAQAPSNAPSDFADSASQRSARVVVDMLFVERARTAMRIWIGARFEEHLRHPDSPLVAREAQYSGIVSETATRASQAALASFDRDFEESRQDMVAYLVATYDEQYLGRLAAFAASSGGGKLFGFALAHGLASPEQAITPPPSEADLAAIGQTFTDAERRAIAEVPNRPGDPHVGDVLDGMGNRYSSWLRGYFNRKSTELSTAAQQVAQAFIDSSRRGRRQ